MFISVALPGCPPMILFDSQPCDARYNNKASRALLCIFLLFIHSPPYISAKRNANASDPGLANGFLIGDNRTQTRKKTLEREQDGGTMCWRLNRKSHVEFSRCLLCPGLHHEHFCEYQYFIDIYLFMIWWGPYIYICLLRFLPLCPILFLLDDATITADNARQNPE